MGWGIGGLVCRKREERAHGSSVRRKKGGGCGEQGPRGAPTLRKREDYMTCKNPADGPPFLQSSHSSSPSQTPSPSPAATSSAKRPISPPAPCTRVALRGTSQAACSAAYSAAHEGFVSLSMGTVKEGTFARYCTRYRRRRKRAFLGNYGPCKGLLCTGAATALKSVMGKDSPGRGDDAERGDEKDVGPLSIIDSRIYNNVETRPRRIHMSRMTCTGLCPNMKIAAEPLP